MHDLTTIQGDEPVGQRPYQTLPEAKKKTRASASESAGMYHFFFSLPKRTIRPKQKWKGRTTFIPFLNEKKPQRIPVDLNRVHSSKVNYGS